VTVLAETTTATATVRLPSAGGAAEDVYFDIAIGSRNQPARDWLARYTGSVAGTAQHGASVRYDVFVANIITPGIAVDVTQ